MRSRFTRVGAISYQYSTCRHQTSPIAGTMPEDTKLALRSWMLGLHLLTRNNMAAPGATCRSGQRHDGPMIGRLVRELY